MKNFILTLLLMVGMVAFSQAQDKPAPSPSGMIKQTVGLTDISVEYSRPGKKDRVVFGELVPYGKMWRAGANAATKVTVSTDCNIGGADLKAGEYALTITPNEDSWDLHFYPYEGSRWSTYRDGDAKPINGKTSEVAALPFDVETFEVMINYLRDDSATLHFVWEKTNAMVPIKVPAG